MKKRYWVLLLGVGLVFLGLFSNSLAYFSTQKTKQMSVVASNVNLQIEPLNTSIIYSIEGTGEETKLTEGSIMSLRFSVKNLSQQTLKIDETLKLAFLTESSESGVLSVYDAQVSNEQILDKTATPLIGADDSDQNDISTSEGTRQGFSKVIKEDELNANETKEYEFKVHLSSSQATTIVENNLELRLVVTGVLSSWTTQKEAYTTIATDLDIPYFVNLELVGDNPYEQTLGQAFNDPGALAVDSLGDNLQVTVDTGQLNVNKIGEYNVYYRAQNQSVSVTKTRTVKVVDRTPPSIALSKEKAEFFVGAETPDWSDMVDVTLWDDVDDSETLNSNLQITTTGDVSYSQPSSHEICFNVTDSSGNKASQKCLAVTVYGYQTVVPEYDTTVAITTHGKAVAWGTGMFGETGMGSLIRQDTPKFIPTLADQTLVQIDGGKYFSIALTDEGKVYVWGRDSSGQQGNGSGIDINTYPTLLNFDKPIVQVKANRETAMALDIEGNVYMWGDCDEGMCGQGDTTNLHKPTLVPNLSNVKEIEVGPYVAYAITNDNRLYGWGRKTDGVLLGETENHKTPCDLTEKLTDISVENIKKISAGVKHTYLLTQSGALYAWGSNNDGQLGQSGSVDTSAVPLLIPVPSNTGETNPPATWVDVAAGHNYGIALDSKGDVYVWGENNYGALGLSGHPQTPQLSHHNPNLKSVAAYDYTSALVTKQGVLYMTGSNDIGELGVGTTVHSYESWQQTLAPQS